MFSALYSYSGGKIINKNRKNASEPNSTNVIFFLNGSELLRVLQKSILTNDVSIELPRRVDLAKNIDMSPKKFMFDKIAEINRK